MKGVIQSVTDTWDDRRARVILLLLITGIILSAVIETHADAAMTVLSDTAAFLAAIVTGMALGALIYAGAVGLYRRLFRPQHAPVRPLWNMLKRLARSIIGR